MNQKDFDSILSVLISFGTEEQVQGFKRLYRKYQQLNGAQMFSHQPTINIYYDKPQEEPKA